MSGEAGCQGNRRTQGFICPFHGWRSNMDGENSFVFGRQNFSEENLEKVVCPLPLILRVWPESR